MVATPYMYIHGWSGEGLVETPIHKIVDFCIFRFQSIWVGISGDNPSFRIYKREKTHALSRLADVVSPFLYTRGYDVLIIYVYYVVMTIHTYMMSWLLMCIHGLWSTTHVSYIVSFTGIFCKRDLQFLCKRDL